MREGWSERTARFVYSACYSGLAPIAPGTAGSAFAAVLLLLPGRLSPLPEWNHWAWIFPIIAVLFVGVWATRYAEARYGRDPGIVVVDEVLGMMITLYLIPNSLAAVGIGFFLFRLFDILKPFPVRNVEHVAGAWGVMLDDALAGVYANICLRVILLLGAKLF